MNIIVCIKQVPSSSEVRIDKNTNTIIREKSESIINPFDMHAIETALRIKKQIGGKVTVISMGITSTEMLLKEAIALGVDEAILLNDKSFAGSDSLATAYILSLGIKKIGDYDLIICGKQAVDGDTAQVGPELAEKLSMPHISYVNKIENIIDGETIQCRRMLDDGYEIIKSTLPALITVVREINEPGLPSLNGIFRAKDFMVSIWGAEQIEADISRCGLKGSPTKVIKSFVPMHDSKCIYYKGNISDQASKLANFLINR